VGVRGGSRLSPLVGQDEQDERDEEYTHIRLILFILSNSRALTAQSRQPLLHDIGGAATSARAQLIR
jgi:hypothetical protein